MNCYLSDSTAISLTKLLFCLIILSCFTSSAAAQTTCTKSYTVAFDNYPPFASVDPKGNWTGIDIDIIKQIFDDAGCAYEFVQLNVRRAHEFIRDGQIDILPAATFSKKRAEYSLFSAPYRNELIHLVGNKEIQDSVLALSLNDLLYQRHYTIAYADTAFYGDIVEKAIDHDKHEQVLIASGSVISRLKLVDSGLVALAIAEPVTAQYHIDMLPFEGELVVIPKELNRSQVRLMFSKKTTTQADIDYLNQFIPAFE